MMGTIFGAIHCVAWNTTLPSTSESLMWRSCSLVVAVVPVFLASLTRLEETVETVETVGASFSRKKLQELETRNWTKYIVYYTAFTIFVPAYVVARLVLIVLSFTTLRALPPGAFVDVDWSMYIPHF
jgi:hypothetical protein